MPFFNHKKVVFYTFFLLFSVNFVFSQTSIFFNTVGNSSFVAPCDVTSITVEVWGAGGAGQRVTGSNTWGGGGSGGGFVKATYTVVPGTTYSLFVGQGGFGNVGGDGQGSWFGSISTIFAVGGIGAGTISTANAYGIFAAAPTTGNIGGTLISTYGGDGGNANFLGTGGGGSSAGNTNGNQALGPVAGGAPTNGYAGATGLYGSGSTVGNNGGIGAGGSGARTNSTTARNGGNGGNGQIKITYTSAAGFQSYCSKSYSTIAPITNVTFAGINNTTPNTSTVANEYFCIAANVVQGQSYYISMKGNTLTLDPSYFTDFYRVYIDWNRNGTYGDAADEIYDIGNLYGSTGIDATVLNGLIKVPDAAPTGTTRMRVVKNRNTLTDACTSVTYGQSEDYTVIVSALPACSGTPTGGSASANPISGAPSSTFGASVSGGTIASGLTYQWQSAPTATGPWTNIVGATNATATITAVATNTTTYYRRIVYCGVNSAISTVTSFTTTTPSYCGSITSTGTENINFIQKVSFLGTLNDVTNTSKWSLNPLGYQDFTYLSNKTIQAQGNGVNVYIEAPQETYFKAWIDWDKNGSFTNSAVTLDVNNNFTAGGGERVYDSGGSSVHSTTFGFVVPNNIAPGDYRLRIKGDYLPGGSNSFNSCANFTNGGETEDYLITVIANCSAIVVSKVNGVRCGTGAVVLQATAAASTPAVSEFRWYDSLTGGTLKGTSPAVGTTTTWNTPPISTNTTYYVTAYNGCESLVRVPVEARVKLVPNVSFTSSDPTICGDKSSVSITATAGNQFDYLIDEDFEPDPSWPAKPALGVFTNVNNDANGATDDAITKWQSKPSIFIPAQKTWFPAITSGVGGNKFATSTSDINKPPTENSLVSSAVNTNTYLSLTLSFDMYFSRYNYDGEDPDMEYIAVEASTNGSTWTIIDKIITDVGIGTKFENKIYHIDGTTNPTLNFLNQPTLQIRLRYYSGDWYDGVAVDNVKLYGERPLTASFNWVSNNPIQVYSDSNATIPYTAGTPISTIYIKPDLTQLQTYEDWEFTATANLTNGCSTMGDISLQNDTKVWNTSASTNWGTLNWMPNPNVPDINKCLIIRQPVNILSGTDGFGKNMKIYNTGKLTINSGGSLTIKDFINNLAPSNTDFTIQSDASLVQLNDGAEITGNATVLRNLKLSTGRQEYSYVSSPVSGFNLRGVYPGVSYSPTDLTYPRAVYYNETNDYFYNSSGSYIAGRGLGLKEPKTTDIPVSPVPLTFTGVPYNTPATFLNYNLAWTNSSHGYNLVGNPFPSNLDLNVLYTASTNIESTFRFWDNSVNNIYVQQGSLYKGYSYAIYNAAAGSGGTGIPAPGTGAVAPGGNGMPIATRTPNNIVKVGQGFVARAKGAGAKIVFKNSERVTSNVGAQFYQKGQTAKSEIDDTYFLILSTPNNLNIPSAIVYFSKGNNAFSDDDSLFDASPSDALYSYAESNKVHINGRSSFVDSDVVDLGASYGAEGDYVISIANTQGKFANGQSVYLFDKVLNTYTDLQKTPYTVHVFKIGLETGRFQIVYQLPNALNVLNANKEGILVYRNGSDFVIRSSDRKINSIEMYDGTGRLVISVNPNNNETVIKGENIANGTYFLKVFRNSEITTRKIIK